MRRRAWRFGLLAVALGVLTTAACADAAGPEGSSLSSGEESWEEFGAGKSDIYGSDDRRDLAEPSVRDEWKRVGMSTAVLVNLRGGVFGTSESTLRLNPAELGQKRAQMCESERYYSDPAPGFCTGFLIAPDLLATAGHCVNKPIKCAEIGVAFGFSKSSPTDTDTTVGREDFYRCEEVVGHVYDRGEPTGSTRAELWYDWAVIRLDREVALREPLEVAYAKEPRVGQQVAAVGHPMGLATKVTAGSVREAGAERYFNTDLDIYRGNSGSPVVNRAGEVLGIVSRGSGGRSFEETEEGCEASRVCEDWGGEGCFGNHVVRPQPLRPFQEPGLRLYEAWGLVEGVVDEEWTSSHAIEGEGEVEFVTVNINGQARQPEALRVELSKGDVTRVLIDDASTLSGLGRWSRTSFGFGGLEAAGEWRLRVVDEGGAEARVDWWKVTVGVGEAGSPIEEPARWIGGGCSVDEDCAFEESSSPAFCYSTQSGEPGFCTVPCEGFCPDRAGHAGTFCVAADVPQMGICVVTPEASNQACAAVPGTTSQTMSRFVGSSGAPDAERLVCGPSNPS